MPVARTVDPRDLVASESPADPLRPTRTLRAFLLYRTVLASTFLLFAWSDTGPAFLGRFAPRLFLTGSLLYTAIALLQGLMSYAGRLPVHAQALLAAAIDIALLTLLMETSGGVETGLGMLLSVSIAAVGGLVPGRVALLLAAVATLSVMGAQVHAELAGLFPNTAYTHAGVLGAAYFAIAILAQVLSERLRRSEQLATRRGLDLANLAELNDYIIQQMQTGVVVLDSRHRIRLLNGAAWQLLGTPDGCRGEAVSVTAPGLARQLARWSGGDPAHGESFRALAHGKDLRAAFAPIGDRGEGGVLVFLEDAARLHEQAQGLKLASLGRLTASIAHEIRNPLGAIGHAGQLLAESTDLPAGDLRLIQIIRTNTGRVNDIIENVLQLSRRDRSHPELIELKPWLLRLAGEIAQRHGLAADQLHLDVVPPDAHVSVDPGQLRQILVNLCENAVHHFDRALPELRVRIVGGLIREAGGPVLDICDNGPGIPPQAVRQIFEPFFTTRASGTGLGLYIARELSESNGVRLEHLPTPVEGTCFRMLFPPATDQRSTR